MKGDKRQLLLQVGGELFSRYGYKDVSIEEIARSAGVGTGSFYTYFSGKEAFYGEILDALEEQGRKEADCLLGSFQSSLNKLKALYRFAILGIRKNPILLGAFTGDKKYLFPGLQARLERKGSLKRHIEATFAQILKEGGRSLELRTGLYRDPQRLAVALFDAVLRNGELMEDTLVLIERGLRRVIRLRAGRVRREQHKLSEREM